jgi:hypothetical protein
LKITAPRTLLRIEALAVLIASVFLYRAEGFHWGIFLILFLAPDLSMIGYLWGTKVGARLYNAGHTYAGPFAMWLTAHFGHIPALVPLALIWVAHIGFDRLLGFGLKYETAFKDTDLGRV